MEEEFCWKFLVEIFCNIFCDLHIVRSPFQGCFVEKLGATTLGCLGQSEQGSETWAACILWETVTQRFESSHKFLTLNNWGILPTLQYITVKNFPTVKATPCCQQGQPTRAVVEAASPMCSLFIMPFWGQSRNPHPHPQGTLGTTMKYKFISSRHMDIKHEHLEQSNLRVDPYELCWDINLFDGQPFLTRHFLNRMRNHG